jgi:hypothetical protein
MRSKIKTLADYEGWLKPLIPQIFSLRNEGRSMSEIAVALQPQCEKKLHKQHISKILNYKQDRARCRESAARNVARGHIAIVDIREEDWLASHERFNQREQSDE